jgi:hypothetical protein
MDASAHASLYTTLTARRSAIADRWYRAIGHTGFAPTDGSAVRARLLALTDQALAALLAEPFAPGEAPARGAALAALHYLHPAALGATRSSLSRGRPAPPCWPSSGGSRPPCGRARRGYARW